MDPADHMMTTPQLRQLPLPGSVEHAAEGSSPLRCGGGGSTVAAPTATHSPQLPATQAAAVETRGRNYEALAGAGAQQPSRRRQHQSSSGGARNSAAGGDDGGRHSGGVARRFSSSATAQRLKQHFAVCANSLTALYQESSMAFAVGAQSARDDVHQYVLDAVTRHAEEGAGGSASGLPPSFALTSASSGVHAPSPASLPTQPSSYGRPQRRLRRWIDADELLAYLSLATLRAGEEGGSCAGRGDAAASAAATGRSGVPGYDVLHTFRRRRPRDASPTWAHHEGSSEDDAYS